MTPELRVLLADAYQSAALAGADMLVAVRAFEAIRAAASGDDSAYAAWDELSRQTGQASDSVLVDTLRQLDAAFEQAIVADDVVAIRRALEQGGASGWDELRRRFARALGQWNFDVCIGIGRAELSLTPEQRNAVDAWLVQLESARRGDWSKTLPLFDSLGRDTVVATPDRARLIAHTAQVHLYYPTGDGNGTGAERAIEEARALTRGGDATPDPVLAEVTCVEGQLHKQHGENKRALELFEKAIELDPSLEDAYAYQGETFENAEPPELEKAERSYEQGIARAPGGTMNVERLARFLGQPERYAARRLRVAELLQQALRVTRKNRYSLYVTFADIAEQNGELDEADRLVTEATKEDPSRPDAWLVAGRSRLKRNDWVGALAMFECAHAAEPETLRAWNELTIDAVEPVLLEAVQKAPSVVAVRALEARLRILAAAPERRSDALTLLKRIESIFGPRLPALLVAARVDVLRDSGQWDAAEAASTTAYTQDGDAGTHRKRLALILNARGNECFSTSDYQGAARWYARALDETPEDAVIWSNLALALENTTGSEGRVDRLARAVAALDRAIEFDAQTPDPEYRRRRDALAALHHLAARYGAQVLDYPAVAPPIGLDVAAGILAQVIVPGTYQLSESCLEAVARVKSWVAREVGVSLPGVYFRELLASGDSRLYVTLLGGLPVTQGSVPSDRWLLLGTPPLEVSADAQPVSDPLSGETGYWVSKADPAAWTALDYALRDLTRIYLRNVRTELTLDDLARLLQPTGLADVDALIGDAWLLQRVTQVVRSLIAERAPAHRLQEIATLVREAPRSQSITELVERARMLNGIREQLRGNDRHHNRLRLGREFSDAVRNAIWRNDTEPALAIEPEACEQCLATIEHALQRYHFPVVVTDDDLRPFVRWLLETQFPDLPVLAERELLGDEAKGAADVVDLPVPPAVGAPA